MAVTEYDYQYPAQLLSSLKAALAYSTHAGSYMVRGT